MLMIGVDVASDTVEVGEAHGGKTADPLTDGGAGDACGGGQGDAGGPASGPSARGLSKPRARGGASARRQSSRHQANETGRRV